MTKQCEGSIFISYARKDAASLAQRLQRDLMAHSFDAWLDTERLAGGVTWTTEIERAIDTCEVVLALLTPGSYVSDICRAEQLRSLRKGKRVIPLLAASDSDIPLTSRSKTVPRLHGCEPLPRTVQAATRRHPGTRGRRSERGLPRNARHLRHGGIHYAQADSQPFKLGA